jgi:hypothetical protein
MRPAGAPPHLLFLHHAFADYLVDRGLDERGGDGLTGAATLPVVGDVTGVGGEVAATELAHRLRELGLGDAGLVGVEVDLQVLHCLQGREDVAMPEKPLQPLQLLDDVNEQLGWGA